MQVEGNYFLEKLFLSVTEKTLLGLHFEEHIEELFSKNFLIAVFGLAVDYTLICSEHSFQVFGLSCQLAHVGVFTKGVF